MRSVNHCPFLKTASTLAAGSSFSNWAKATEFSLGSANVVSVSDGVMQRGDATALWQPNGKF